MPRTFKLTSWRRPLKSMATSTKKRMSSNMRDQVTMCDWLYEASLNTPERALGVAVLQRAVLDLITPGVRPKDRDGALTWIKGEHGEDFESDYALSFTRVVESFSDIPVDDFRNKILQFAETAKVQEAMADGFRFQRG